MAGSQTQGCGLQEYSPSLSHVASNPRLFQKGHRPPVPLTEQAACSHSQAVEQLLNSEGTGVCWGRWTSEPHCSLDVKGDTNEDEGFLRPKCPTGCFGHSTFLCEPCWNIKEPFWAASGVRWPWTQGGGQCGHHQGLLKPSAAVPPGAWHGRS